MSHSTSESQNELLYFSDVEFQLWRYAQVQSHGRRGEVLQSNKLWSVCEKVNSPVAEKIMVPSCLSLNISFDVLTVLNAELKSMNSTLV